MQMRVEPREPIHILILGPMSFRNERLELEQRTRDLKLLVEDIRRSLQADATLALPDIDVRSPEDRRVAMIVPGVMDMVEEAELVIADLSHRSANVAYEVGLIHALGIPHILITDEEQPPFYFLTREHFAMFSVATTYDPRQPSHVNLRQKIIDFASSPDIAEGLTDNEVTRYYKLPIVDISGPSGLAAGYYMNAIRRFVRDNGFFDDPCKLVGQERRLKIDHFIAVRPPDLATTTYLDDSRALNAELVRLGLSLRFASIEKRPDEALDIRDYGGQFLVRDAGKGDFVEPAIIIEIPTTLYALQFMPRIRKIEEMQSGRRDQGRAVVEQKRRRLGHMLERFEVNLRFQIETDHNRIKGMRLQIIDLADLEDTLRAIPGVLGD